MIAGFDHRVGHYRSFDPSHAGRALSTSRRILLNMLYLEDFSNTHSFEHPVF
jgi:hypothetical protein